MNRNVALFVGYVRKTTRDPAAVDRCAVAAATGAKWSRFGIDATASITGAVTSGAKPAPRKSK